MEHALPLAVFRLDREAQRPAVDDLLDVHGRHFVGDVVIVVVSLLLISFNYIEAKSGLGG